MLRLLFVVLLLLSIGLSSTSVLAQFNASGIRVEIDPDVSSIAANCTSTFKKDLNNQLLKWVTSGLAMNIGYKPPLPQSPFKNYVWAAQCRGGRNRMLRQSGDDEPSELLATSQEVLDRALKCSWTNCNNCCIPFCITSCYGCSMCERRRQLGAANNIGKDDEYTTRDLRLRNGGWWWWGNQDIQGKLSNDLQTMMRTWLDENDSKKCLGNPWTAKAVLSWL